MTEAEMCKEARAAFKNPVEDMFHHMQARKPGMVRRELENFRKGSDKISSFKLIQRIEQCHEEKKSLLEFAVGIKRFSDDELDRLTMLVEAEEDNF